MEVPGAPVASVLVAVRRTVRFRDLVRVGGLEAADVQMPRSGVRFRRMERDGELVVVTMRRGSVRVGLVRPAAGLEHDAEGLPRRDAHDGLREQDRRDKKKGEGPSHLAGRYRLDSGARRSVAASVRRTAPAWIRPRRGGLLQLVPMIRCNIDQRGRTIRLVLGAVLETAGLVLGALWFFEWAPGWTIWPAAAIWISGMFVIFEALVGWCAVRAMGLRTPF